jgi:hypothetical protein
MLTREELRAMRQVVARAVNQVGLRERRSLWRLYFRVEEESREYSRFRDSVVRFRLTLFGTGLALGLLSAYVMDRLLL